MAYGQTSEERKAYRDGLAASKSAACLYKNEKLIAAWLAGRKKASEIVKANEGRSTKFTLESCGVFHRTPKPREQYGEV